jgi:hypothetical protein
MRYIKDKATGTIHDTEHLSERCNSDDIEDENKAKAEDLAELLGHEIGKPAPHFCQWCMQGHAE